MARHDDEDDDAFDERGCLKDGRSVRVSMQMRDAVMADAEARDAARRVNHLALHRPGPRYCTDQAARDAVEEARAEWIAEMCDAWKNKPAANSETGFGSGEFRGAVEGDICTVREGGVDEGGPGHLRMVSGKLTCVPDKRSQDSAPPRSMSIADAQRIRDEAWRASVEADENAWRGPGR